MGKKMKLFGTIILIEEHAGPAKAGRVFSSNRTFSIGRDKSCDVVLEARGVSKRHCELVASESGWSVRDLGSTNGVLVNSKRLLTDRKQPNHASILKQGDRVQIGEAILRIEFDSTGGDKTEILILSSEKDNSDSSQRSGAGGNTSYHPMKPVKTFVAGKGSISKPSNGRRKEASAIQSTPANLDCSEMTQDEARREFRDYLLMQRIGSGGMGEVWLARKKSKDSEECAIKFLKHGQDQSTAEQDRRRFAREMQIATSMNHPAVVRCVDCGQDDENLFIVMEYCDGGNLGELLRRTGKLSERRAIRLLDRLLGGIAHAHELGIVHRDLKPSNILLQRTKGGKYVPKIADFGLAKYYLLAGDSGMTVQGSVGGSWNYMPKEQLTDFRFVSPRSDVWSVAAMFFETLTLTLPRPSKRGVDPIRTILGSKHVSLGEAMPDAHPELVQFVDRCLDPVPENRFEDAIAMRKGLRRVAEILEVNL
jgi:pSer/pThr/pTyr-binding forkhead associated (FHA) protein